MHCPAVCAATGGPLDPNCHTCGVALSQFAQRLAAAGTAIEAYFDGVAQDIEGGLVAGAASQPEGAADLYIFQSRPQL